MADIISEMLTSLVFCSKLRLKKKKKMTRIVKIKEIKIHIF